MMKRRKELSKKILSNASLLLKSTHQMNKLQLFITNLIIRIKRMKNLNMMVNTGISSITTRVSRKCLYKI